MRTIVVLACLAVAVHATAVFEIADDAGSVAIGAALDSSLTRKRAGVLGAPGLQVDQNITVVGSAAFNKDVTLSAGLAVAGDVSMASNVAMKGTATVTGAATLSSTLNVNGAATLNSLSVSGGTTVNTLTANGIASFTGGQYTYMNGILRDSRYKRTRMSQAMTKLFSFTSQACLPSTATIIQFQHCQSGPSGSAAGDGFTTAPGMWTGAENVNVAGQVAQNALRPLYEPNSGDPGTRYLGFYRVEGFATFSGCSPSQTSKPSTGSDNDYTVRSLYIATSSSLGGTLRYSAGNSARGVLETSLHVSDTIYMQPGWYAWLVMVNNCGGNSANAILTRGPLQPDLSTGSTDQLPGPYAGFSITYIGED